MNWSLITIGVMAGIGLVIAKQWFDRWVEGGGRKEGPRRRAAPVSANKVSRRPEVSRPLGAAKGRGAPDGGDSGLDGAADPEQGSIGAERVEEALASRDLSTMEKALEEVADPIQRNLLLSRLVAAHYRRRSEPQHREAFHRVAYAQVEEAEDLLNALVSQGRPRPDHIDAFKMLAIALGEEGRYDEAIAICEKALSLGLEDGTKTGFKGRIARLKRQRDSE